MSGVCGIYGFGVSPLTSDANLRRMLAAIGHRGQELCTFTDPEAGIALGFTRGAVGAWHEGDRWVAGLDGRLVDGGCATRAPPRNDARRVAESLEHHPEAFGQELDGPFAAAAFDRAERTLWLWRGPLGAKPLYCAHLEAGNLVVFASELKGVLAHPSIERRLDRDALSAFLVFGYVPAPLSAFEGIRKVFPGEVQRYERSGRRSARQRGSLSRVVPREDGMDELAEELRGRVRSAFAYHLDGVARPGVFLSGGVDSTVALGVLQELGYRDPHTFTLGFDKPTARADVAADLPWGELAARRLGARHHPVVIEKGHDPNPLLPRVWAQFDEPMLTPNAYSKYFLAEAARRAGVDCCITGNYGAILFERLSRHKFEKRLLKAPPGADPDEIVLSLRTKLLPWEAQDALLVEPVSDPRERALEIIRRYRRGIDSDELPDVLKGVYLRMQEAEKSATVFDRTAALHGVDVLHPLGQAELIRFARAVPARFKGSESGKMNKAILKAAFADLLPAEIAARKKIGYPSYYWTHGEVSALEERLLSRASLERTGLLRPDAVARILEDDARSVRKSTGKRTWGLLVLQAWYTLHVLQDDSFFEPATGG